MTYRNEQNNNNNDNNIYSYDSTHLLKFTFQIFATNTHIYWNSF